MLMVLTIALDRLLRLAAIRLRGLDRLPAITWLGLGALGWIIAWGP
jgi:hypothetical protein